MIKYYLLNYCLVALQTVPSRMLKYFVIFFVLLPSRCISSLTDVRILVTHSFAFKVLTENNMICTHIETILWSRDVLDVSLGIFVAYTCSLYTISNYLPNFQLRSWCAQWAHRWIGPTLWSRFNQINWSAAIISNYRRFIDWVAFKVFVISDPTSIYQGFQLYIFFFI